MMLAVGRTMQSLIVRLWGRLVRSTDVCVQVIDSWKLVVLHFYIELDDGDVAGGAVEFVASVCKYVSYIGCEENWLASVMATII